MADDNTVPLHSGAFHGRDTFQQLIRDALAAASRENWREIVLADPDFSDWPLYERAVAESLQAWSETGRKCILLARRYDDVVRRHARFVTWRKTWSHIVDARGCPSAAPLEMPSAIWTPTWAMERRALERSSGYRGPEPDRRLALREKLDQWLGKSTPAFPASTLGL